MLSILRTVWLLKSVWLSQDIFFSLRKNSYFVIRLRSHSYNLILSFQLFCCYFFYLLYQCVLLFWMVRDYNLFFCFLYSHRQMLFHSEFRIFVTHSNAKWLLVSKSKLKYTHLFLRNIKHLNSKRYERAINNGFYLCLWYILVSFPHQWRFRMNFFIWFIYHPFWC